MELEFDEGFQRSDRGGLLGGYLTTDYTDFFGSEGMGGRKGRTTDERACFEGRRDLKRRARAGPPTDPH
jgi:hypothetical protein